MSKRPTIFVTWSIFHKFSCLQRDYTHYDYLRTEYLFALKQWIFDGTAHTTKWTLHLCTYISTIDDRRILLSSLHYPHIFMNSSYIRKTKGSGPTRHQNMINRKALKQGAYRVTVYVLLRLICLHFVPSSCFSLTRNCAFTVCDSYIRVSATKRHHAQ